MKKKLLSPQTHTAGHESAGTFLYKFIILRFSYIDKKTDFFYYIQTFAAVAQLVERRTENPYVVGSIPTCGTWLLTLLEAIFFVQMLMS